MKRSDAELPLGDLTLQEARHAIRDALNKHFRIWKRRALRSPASSRSAWRPGGC